MTNNQLYYLDSNICIAYLRGKNDKVLREVTSRDKNIIKIPVVVDLVRVSIREET